MARKLVSLAIDHADRGSHKEELMYIGGGVLLLVLLVLLILMVA